MPNQPQTIIKVRNWAFLIVFIGSAVSSWVLLLIMLTLPKCQLFLPFYPSQMFGVSVACTVWMATMTKLTTLEQEVS